MSRALARVAVFLGLVLSGFTMPAPSIFADGEAGIVVVWGDGTTSSACVAFKGDSITGDDLIAAAGLGTNEFSGAVCSINDVGCTHTGSFGSCLCKCQAGSADCIYWSFFTRDYGEKWVYSALGYRSVSSSNGDLQAWQWLPASSSVPPAPPPQAFEDVCGHPPLEALPPLPPVSTVPPTPASTRPPGSPPPPPGSTTVAAFPTVASPPPQGTTPLAPTVTPAPPSSGKPGEDGNGGATLLRFGAVVAALLAATAGLLFVRRRHGN